MKKRILILTTTSDFLWKFEKNNVKILQKMGYEVHYATNIHEPDYYADREQIQEMHVILHHVDIARSPFMLQNNQKALRQIMSIIQQYAIQVIHCHTPVGGLLGRLAGKLCGKKEIFVIYTAHGFHFYKGAPLTNQLVYYQVEKTLARYTDFLIVINREDYKAAKWFRLKKNGRVYQIPGEGLNTDYFYPLTKEEKKQCRNKLHIDEHTFFFVSVGELNENKNHQIVLQALSYMKQKGKDLSRIRYGICGDGFFREKLEQQIITMGLADVVTLFGYRSDVRDILGCADASIFPSRREGLGMAGLESLSLGVPVIAADNRGTREYMKPGRNGFMCRFDNAIDFAKAMEAMSRIDTKKREKMQTICRKSVEPFDIKHASLVMERVYLDIDQRIGWDEHET